MRSLVSAGLVCWSWNSAAVDNNLWSMNYSLFFGACNVNGINIPVVSGVQNIYGQNSTDSVSIGPNFGWKELFHDKYAECEAWRFASNRALCGHCRSVIWLSNLTCASPHHCSKDKKDEVKLRPLLPDNVAEYILHAEDLAASSSDGDDANSDSDDEYEHRRFWLL
ncbi:hypothetical protein QOZ80_5AG0365870 [Eleusine coracana subsp. coracana]|nr:hypothetical protein QOZ80_5AG0365870 [Eleusine coracana subsp. coracana]